MVADTEKERHTLEEWMRLRGIESDEMMAVKAGGYVASATVGRIRLGQGKPIRGTKRTLADALGVSEDQIIWPE